MPVSVQMAGANQVLERLKQKLSSPELVEQLGTSLATQLSAVAPRETGATAAALGTVGTPTQTGAGWSIGVGDKEKVGNRNEPAPSGTLRDFYEYLKNTGNGVKPTDWWGLAPDLKELLASERRTGRFGGRGAGYANYMWVQNYGNAKARIRGTYFLQEAIKAWRAQVSEIVRAYFATK